MTVKIRGREIDGIIVDVHGVFYDNRNKDQIFTPLQLSLARSLLSGKQDPTEDDVLLKRQEYANLAHKIGSWRRAFIVLGGNEARYLNAIGSIDWTGKFVRNQELVDLLYRLNSTVAVGILSGGLTSMSEPICSQILGTDWRRLFQATVFDDTTGLPAKKPDKKAFLHTVQLMKVETARAAVIDDSPVAVVSAAALGMLTIYVGDQEGIGDLRISRIEDLKNLIE